MKKISVRVDLFMTDAFIKEWIIDNLFFGEGKETEYGVGYVKDAVRGYIIEHDTTGISFKHKLIEVKDVRG